MNLRDNLCEMNGQVGFAERKINSQRNLNEYRFEIAWEPLRPLQGPHPVRWFYKSLVEGIRRG